MPSTRCTVQDCFSESDAREGVYPCIKVQQINKQEQVWFDLFCSNKECEL